MEKTPFELLRSKRLLPKEDARSDVWNFFGFKTDSDDESKILNHTEVMCALCETLLTYSGSTTSLRCHLRASHPGDYRKVEETSSNAPSTPSRSDVGARPSRLRKRDTPSNQFETDVSIFIFSLCVCVCV